MAITSIFQLPDNIKWETLFYEPFTDNSRNWEEVDIPTEYAAITESGYTLQNRGNSNWTFYHLPMPLLPEDNFELRARIETAERMKEGEFGLVWGFGKKPELLNRFALSTDGRRCTVCYFEKNHRQIFHRFHALLPDLSTYPAEFFIRKYGAYYFFYLNNLLVYVGHKYHFTWQGNRIGFYVEPGLSITVTELSLIRLI